MLLFHDQNYGIHYEYTIPVNQSTENQSEPAKPQDALFLWTHSGWEGCSVQCGGGKVGVGGGECAAWLKKILSSGPSAPVHTAGHWGMCASIGT